MLFKDIIGQDTIKRQLISEIKAGRIPHAQLFYGPAGVGKLPLAIAYARYLLCTHPQENDACGTCQSCKMIDKLAHPDLHFVFPVIKKSISNDYIEKWRKCVLNNPYFSFEDWLECIDAKNAQPVIYVKESDELIKKLSIKSFEGGFKVAIIWLPERMNEETANKLLKIVEEPPQQTVLLLVSEEPNRILPTIVSRTQPVNITKVPEGIISDLLSNQYNIPVDRARNIAHLSDGNVTIALQQISTDTDNDIHLFYDLFVSLMRLAYQRKIREMKQWSEQLASMGRERQRRFLTYCERMIRENFICNLHQPELNYMSEDESNFAQRFSPFVNEKNVKGIFTELNSAIKDIQRNVSAKIVFFDLSLKMIMLLKN